MKMTIEPPAIQIGREFRDECDHVIEGDMLSVENSYQFVVWFELLKPNSLWFGKTLSVVVYCKDPCIQILENCKQLSIPPVYLQDKKLKESVSFPFRIGTKEPKNNLAIIYIDILYGPKTPISLTTIGKIKAQKI